MTVHPVLLFCVREVLALAIVVEIVFAKGESPLHGDLPLYVVIDLKTYCGPVWDKENPTVRIILYQTQS